MAARRRRFARAALALGVAWSARFVPPAEAVTTPSPTATATVPVQPGADATAFPLRFGRFGEVQVHRTAQTPSSFTILVSGERGRDATGVELTVALVAHGSAVVTIDGPRYLEALNRPGAGCQYLGGDFEGLAHEVQRRLGLESYLLPVLAGYSSGASLAAVVLEQSPKGTYAGLLSIDFRPDLDLRRAPCRGSSLTWQPRARSDAGAGHRAGPAGSALAAITLPRGGGGVGALAAALEPRRLAGRGHRRAARAGAARPRPPSDLARPARPAAA